jgi:hypothetical protein
MALLEQYRPPGRSNRSGRTQADNDVFEGLPVKQWGLQHARISLAPPVSESEIAANDKWGDPPMPRDYQLLQPWTQQLLRLARSGKVGTKRKSTTVDHQHGEDADDDAADEGEKGGDEVAGAKVRVEDRGYVAKKWKIVPEAMLEPEHKHFEFLAKRRKGLPSLYGPDASAGLIVPMRKTKVQKVGTDGEVNVYEVLVPEGQHVEGEVAESTELADVKPVIAAPGTVIEGVGIANEDGVVVAEHLKPSVAPRRNRPPPKKKGGPGRGKKRVTFTNPDGSTYTKIVPNATKIVPEPGQTVKHVSKGEEAAADVTAEQAAASAATAPADGEGEGDEEGEDGEDDGEEGEDDEDREEGELSDEDAPETTHATPAPPPTADAEAADDAAIQGEEPPTTANGTAMTGSEPKTRDASSSPELPLAKTSHSRQGSTVTAATTTAAAADSTDVVDMPDVPPEPAAPDTSSVNEVPARDVQMTGPDVAEGEPETETFEDGDEDLLGNLEKHLGGEGAAE